MFQKREQAPKFGGNEEGIFKETLFEKNFSYVWANMILCVGPQTLLLVIPFLEHVTNYDSK
jgi:hypothetical protein